ncbi:MAG TPA: (Fe-S)-binding protein [Acidimicrobiales bacterium]|nr:(Fe-S)-binding protein [Acidimicrobiales bacterium]
MKLRLDDAELASCVACGLCLPHCPTYRVTGDESASPRGRIAAMRAVQWDGAPMDDTFAEFMHRCVQCRGCEPACPSSVPFGRLMEGARAALGVPWWKRVGYRVLTRRRLLLALSSALAVLQRLRLVPSRRLGLPPLPVRRPRLRSSGTDVWLFTSCVMDAWQRDTHAAVQRVLEAAGAGVALSPPVAACCGALHLHAGLVDDARGLAERAVAAMPGPAPILVDSAGCGAHLKEHSDRVLDVHEWLATRPLPAPTRRFDLPVVVQDPCHLRNVQRAHEHVRTVLRPYAELVELDDDGLCCGAGGAYAAQQPELARAIRDRKLAAVARSGATVVAGANPGCVLHLRAAGVDARHPLEIVDEVLRDGR